jgi:hypothetical protein
LLRAVTCAAIVLTFSSATFAVDFDPVKHGLAEPSDKQVYRDPGLNCTFLRNAVDGPKKVWSCDDGSLRYGDSDVWSRPGDPKVEDKAVEPFDQTISIPDHSLMTITTWINNRYCHRVGAKRRCNGREVQSLSHMLVPMGREECLKLAEKIAYRDYIAAMAVDDRIRISYHCE